MQPPVVITWANGNALEAPLTLKFDSLFGNFMLYGKVDVPAPDEKSLGVTLFEAVGQAPLVPSARTVRFRCRRPSHEGHG